jgi:hypothetical protein
MINNTIILKICQRHFLEVPKAIEKQRIGISNEVYLIAFSQSEYFIRINSKKDNLIGTKKFISFFKDLEINVPEIYAEDYTGEYFHFSYQILSKINGVDLEIILEKLNELEVRLLAKDISKIINNFKQLKSDGFFGIVSGTLEEKFNNQFEVVVEQQRLIANRNKVSSVLRASTLLHIDFIIKQFSEYLTSVKPTLYFEDMISKNVMIFEGKFNGLVDIDYLRRGDILDLIGKIVACWNSTINGKLYVESLIKEQNLDKEEINCVKFYAILNLAIWITEEGIKFNSNSSTVINWDNVKLLTESLDKLISDVYHLSIFPNNKKNTQYLQSRQRQCGHKASR